MLWAETVVDGDDKGRCFISETTADCVVGSRGRAEVGEATSMEENDDRESSIGGCVGGSEEAEPEPAGGIADDGVGGDDGADGFGVGRSFEIKEAEKTFADGAVSGEGGVR